MGVLLALVAAVGYGLSDFVGGLAARRTSAWPVAFVGAVAALAGSLALAVLFPGEPTGTHLAWGVLAGVGSGVGGAFLYRGLSVGRMGVVAPISAVGAALLPVVVGVGAGERPALLIWLGIAAAVPGIWLVSREPGGGGTAAAGLSDGVGDGVVAGSGFGVLFVAMGQVPGGAGFWPLVAAQAVAVVAVAAVAAAGAAAHLRLLFLGQHGGHLVFRGDVGFERLALQIRELAVGLADRRRVGFLHLLQVPKLFLFVPYPAHERTLRLHELGLDLL